MIGGADDPGLLTPAQTCLLTDQYELAMAASYFMRGMNAPRLVMRDGRRVNAETLPQLAVRATAQLEALPARLRLPDLGAAPEPYPVGYSERLSALAMAATPAVR
jgi:hypothetical protein